MKRISVLLLGLTLAACNSDPKPAATDAKPSPSAHATSAATPHAALRIVRWGNDHAKVGEGFNKQPDGKSGLWFELSDEAPGELMTGTFDGKPLTGVVANGKTVTATVPLDYLSVAGSYPVELQIPSTGTKISAGLFQVEYQ